LNFKNFLLKMNISRIAPRRLRDNKSKVPKVPPKIGNKLNFLDLLYDGQGCQT
jgi:hypothetical protein